MHREWRFFLVPFLAFLCFLPDVICAQPDGEMTMNFKGRPQRVTYSTYIPAARADEPFAVVVCVGGLPMQGDQYAQSDTRECMDEHWIRFADKNRVVLLGVGFLFIEKDWAEQASYQFPRAWSGQALLEILETLSRKVPIDSRKLYLFGISAGAQFSVRFAQLRPDLVRAVAAHAAGGYDPPREFIPTQFLLTVGELDNGPISRLEFARAFAQAAREKGIKLELAVIPGIGHRQTEEQNEMSRTFFQNVREENR